MLCLSRVIPGSTWTWHPRNQNGVVELEEFIDFVMYGEAGGKGFWLRQFYTVNRLNSDGFWNDGTWLVHPSKVV